MVERLLKALRTVCRGNVRQFFALASQHARWELNDVARRLDAQPSPALLDEGLASTPDSDSGLTLGSRRIFEAIDNLPDDEREAFDLVRIQGMSFAEAAEILGVSGMTVNRRLNRGLRILAEQLSDMRPDDSGPKTV